MKLDYPRKWFEQHIEHSGNEEVGAGIPSLTPVCPQADESKIKTLDTRLALGQFVELWRRNRGWNAEDLAINAGIDVEEVLEIEHNPYCEPEASAIHKLAPIMGVSSRRLLELAGLVKNRTPCLREAAIRFAARSESISALSEVEKEAFEAFVTTLTAETES